MGGQIQNQRCIVRRVLATEINNRIFLIDIETRRFVRLVPSEAIKVRSVFNNSIGSATRGYNSEVLFLEICFNNNQLSMSFNGGGGGGYSSSIASAKLSNQHGTRMVDVTISLLEVNI
ncbi:hypothetical protein IC619_011615 [Hazenella sp. IB182353]|uniref:hypothetical protein n=1 Tax=Polycladospora coralii TaxID=2771432 RepID=UPI001747A3FF|nr:hypothetical protein [Polycladospora coralii]MBS7531143.1 hypothetical protein [Polycladospora coralii]